MAKIKYTPTPKNRTLDLFKSDYWQSPPKIDQLLSVNSNYCEIRRKFHFYPRTFYFLLMFIGAGSLIFSISIGTMMFISGLKRNIETEFLAILFFL